MPAQLINMPSSLIFATLLIWGLVAGVVFLNILFVLPPLVRDSWAWLQDALKSEQRPTADVESQRRQAVERARLELASRVGGRR